MFRSRRTLARFLILTELSCDGIYRPQNISVRSSRCFLVHRQIVGCCLRLLSFMIFFLTLLSFTVYSFIVTFLLLAGLALLSSFFKLFMSSIAFHEPA